MTEDRGRQVAALFHQALDWPPQARQELLRRSCSDAEIVQEVEALLAADDELADAELAVTTAAAPAGTGPEEGDARGFEELPERIGPYRPERKLGEGGMSTVYLARRSDGELRRKVALKLVRPELLSPEVLRRFEAERQILAHLDHPAIARLFDAGRTEAGVPYFVMEAIEGRPIDEHCAALRIPNRERARLFRQICSAVHYAHQNLVIHRDIKPSNVLVSADGHPKLLDFGIARVLDPELLPRGSEPTCRWERLLTPEYASPEQLLGLPVTTASDVYSLGALLFKVLTGQLPFALEGRSPAEIERLVSSAEPPRPSAVAGAPIDGDLEAIVAMALRKEPHRRYASAEQLGEDLDRYLAGLPVRAHRRSLRYRAGKFVRRYRLGIGAALTFVGLAVAVAAALRVQSRSLEEQREEALRERERALAVTTFVAGLFRAEDPERPLGETLTTRRLLDSAVERIAAELAAQPESQADLLSTLGSVYLDLGLYGPARSALEGSLETRQRLLDPQDDRLAESLQALGALELEVGHFAASEGLLRRALAIRRSLEQGPARAQALLRLGRALYAQGRLADAEIVLPELLEAARRPEPPDERTAAQALDLLGQVLWAQGRLRESENALRQALDSRRRLYGEESWAVAETTTNLALVVDDLGDAVAARELLEKAAAQARTLFGDRHLSRAVILTDLAGLAIERRDPAAAVPLYREGLNIARNLFPPGYPHLSHPLLGLGVALLDLGDAAGAEAYLAEAFELRQRALPAPHPGIARARELLDRCRRELAGAREGPAAPEPEAMSTALIPRASGWCVPDGGFDDSLTRTSCCSGLVAVHASTVCAEPKDRGTTWASCSQICGTRPVGGCIPSGGIDDTLDNTSCCSGVAVPGSTRCLNPADYGGSWRTCVQTCA